MCEKLKKHGGSNRSLDERGRKAPKEQLLCAAGAAWEYPSNTEEENGNIFINISLSKEWLFTLWISYKASSVYFSFSLFMLAPQTEFPSNLTNIRIRHATMSSRYDFALWVIGRKHATQVLWMYRHFPTPLHLLVKLFISFDIRRDLRLLPFLL